VIRVIKATLVLKDLVERRVRLVIRVSKVFRVHKEKRETKVTPVQLVLRVNRVFKVSKAQKETKAIKVILVRLVHRGLREILVRLDLRVQKAMPLLMQTLPQSSSPL